MPIQRTNGADTMIETKIRCLVVDDEPDFAEFVADALETFEFDVDICVNSAELGRVYSTKHQIIILDLFMPSLDGIEVLRFLHDNGSKVPLIFMSGKDESVLHSAKELAMEWQFPVLGILQKPFTIDELEDVIGQFELRKNTSEYSGQIEISVIDISNAIKEGEFSLVYQPQIRLKDASVCGVEALIRWVHPEKGNISPAFFIPFAEKNGVIEGINEFVMRNAIKQLSEWRQRGHNISVSINLSPASIADVNFPEVIFEFARKHDVPPSGIIIEVTETAVMADVGRYMDILTRLRIKGFGLAIDDFGTGYSSLQQLVRLPFSELKIDRVFISNLSRDKECEMVVKMAIDLAHNLNLTVVAEGVEDSDTIEKLKRLGCDRIQGYFCSKPIGAEFFEDWLTESIYHESVLDHSESYPVAAK